VHAEQLGLEGMPRRLYACTPSRLNSWLDCPRRYRFTYLDRPAPAKGPPWAHHSLGSSVHNALRSWWDVPLAGRTPRTAGDLVESGWLTDGYRDQAQSASVLSRARAMVERYTSRLDPAVEPRAVERTVATKTETLALSGRVDRVDHRPDLGRLGPTSGEAEVGEAEVGEAEVGEAEVGEAEVGGPPGGELVVVDYKTGRARLTADDARGSLALAVYVLGVRRTLRASCRRVELHHLPTGDVAGFDHTQASLGRHLGRAESIAAEAGAADLVYRSAAAGEADLDVVFPARPGPMCGWCDFQQQCPQGLAAARPRRPWDGVEELALE